MNRLPSAMLLLTVVVASVTAVADFVREDELDFVSAVQQVEVEQAIDLRSCWRVGRVDEIGLRYSAVGWDFAPQPSAGAYVRLNLQDGRFSEGTFHPGSTSIDLALGLTGKGTYAWQPDVAAGKVYRVLHETTRSGRVVEDETFDACFEFYESLSHAEFYGAVLGVSQPVVLRDDPVSPWSRIGGDGDGLCNSADGATLAFTFMGAGTFAAELSFAEGSVSVVIDGETADTVQPGAQWTPRTWRIEDYDAHNLTLIYSGEGEIRVRGCALTDGFMRDIDLCETEEASCDLRTAFPVAKLKGEPALKGLAYSAIGWEREAADDPTRKVTITALSGTFVNGGFMPDGAEGITVLPSTGGRGVFDWRLKDISKRVFQLTHTVKEGGVADAAGLLHGYFDFTQCDTERATQDEVEKAVLGEITHPIAVRQDKDRPWQPIGTAEECTGIATDEWLEPEDETATSFAFTGCGVLHCEYALSGGMLKVIADGECILTCSEATTGWTPVQVPFADFVPHEVAFAYVAAGGAVASIRNVRWEESDCVCANGEGDEIRVDLREGDVRLPKKFDHVLPFVYSPTNFIGTVAGTSSRVSIVELTGESQDVTQWTTEVPGTFKVLKESEDEGEVVWRAKKGVWKVTFEIFDGPTLKETQIKFFDLRTATGKGFMLIIS